MIPLESTLEQKKFPVVTSTIILICIVVYPLEPFLFLSESGDRLFLFGPGSLSPVGLFTSMFLHADLFHLIFNMVYLWAFGPAVEQRVGKKLFLLYYLGAGIAAHVLQTGMIMLVDPSNKGLSLGASGAISGIMALYVYRCYFAKVRMVLSPVYLPFAANIPAAPVVLFWFLQDLFRASTIPLGSQRVGYLAHVGGFLFGLVVARMKRYGREGTAELHSERIEAELRTGGGWKEFRSEESLLALVRTRPDDPGAKVQLAQYYAAKREKAKASSSYKDAVRVLFSSNPLFAAFTVLEHHDALGLPCPLEYHVRAAGIFAEQADHLPEALRVIEPVLGAAAEGALGEKAHILYLKICQEMGESSRVADGIRNFHELFPRSASRSIVNAIPSLRPGTIFPRRKIALPDQYVRSIDEDEEVSKFGSWATREIGKVMGLIASPLFVSLWIGLYLAMSFVVGRDRVLEVLSQFVAFFAAAIVASFYRWMRSEWSWRHKVTDEQEARARAEADLELLRNKAALADRGGNHARAAELYERVLVQDKGNIQARFRLAKIYLQDLNDRGNGLMQFRKLREYLPKDHPYYAETISVLKSPSGGPK